MDCPGCGSYNLDETNDNIFHCNNCKYTFFICSLCSRIDDPDDSILCIRCHKDVCETCLSNGRMTLKDDKFDLYICEKCLEKESQ